MGRRIDAAAYAVWEQRCERFERSRLTVAEFCRREGVSQPTFYQWRKRLRAGPLPDAGATGLDVDVPVPSTAESQGSQAAFVELSLPCAAVVELELPNGVRVRVPADRETVLVTAIRVAGELRGNRTEREAAPC